ncbi:phytanoyl-CoA dioxygenase family protein [Streptomyces sp. AP-93]|uniref:phytanoyl-CoA dioxygenase family protein n=1 Tax=Streptomyces sp. AP-93 TaxID=2929048 RepID=UPI001FAF90E8|nr:phytanoyl-CoA dioxygenase family protein [Streptomyces sp. AP-93]MCJ0874479.1 phytanoyl-CoA dioxygenase family protein [Streptomyces sp. AP-93]
MGTTPQGHRIVRDPAPWEGDDQEWWDWYMTLAADPGPDRVDLKPGPELHNAAMASEREVSAALAEPYPLTDDAVRFFHRHGYVRLPAVLPPAVIAALAARAHHVLEAAHGRDNPGRFLALEQLWLTDPVLRDVALSRRLGDIAARLLRVEAVRLYHDNTLSKEPGCGRTPWHRDSDHYPLDSPSVVTSWFPLHDIPTEMGPLACLPRQLAPAVLHALPASPEERSYDEHVAGELRAAGAVPDASPFALGDVSFHAADCFHTAGANLTMVSRRVLSSTYYADGTRITSRPTMLSGSWTDFVPGVEPGAPAASALNPVVGLGDRPPSAY